MLGCPLKSDRARTLALSSLSLSSLKDKKKSNLALLSNMICARREIRRNWSEQRPRIQSGFLSFPLALLLQRFLHDQLGGVLHLFSTSVVIISKREKKKVLLLCDQPHSCYAICPEVSTRKGERDRETNKWLCWLLETRFFFCLVLFFPQSSNHNPLCALDICEYLRTDKLVRDRITRFPNRYRVIQV